VEAFGSSVAAAAGVPNFSCGQGARTVSSKRQVVTFNT
jgi:hypothetical protein